MCKLNQEFLLKLTVYYEMQRLLAWKRQKYSLNIFLLARMLSHAFRVFDMSVF